MLDNQDIDYNFVLHHRKSNMIIKNSKIFFTLLFVYSSQFLSAASFDKYFPKLIKLEGNGFGIHKPIWGNRDFAKSEACAIYKKHYWDKYHASAFESQGVAEVLIDQLINAGEGKESVNIKAFEAILGVKQDGILSLSDIEAANDFAFPEQVINPYVNYRLHYYRSRKNFDIYPGWAVRAKSFMILDTLGNMLADYLILPKILLKETEQVIPELKCAEVIAKN